MYFCLHKIYINLTLNLKTTNKTMINKDLATTEEVSNEVTKVLPINETKPVVRQTRTRSTAIKATVTTTPTRTRTRTATTAVKKEVKPETIVEESIISNIKNAETMKDSDKEKAKKAKEKAKEKKDKAKKKEKAKKEKQKAQEKEKKKKAKAKEKVKKAKAKKAK